MTRRDENAAPPRYGTEVSLVGRDSDTFSFRTGLIEESETEAVFFLLNGVKYHIPALDDTWSWVCAPVTFGLLVDMSRACVTLRFNAHDALCLDLTRNCVAEGLEVRVESFPDEVEDAHGGVAPVIVSCSTPPTPTSLLAAAAEPLGLDAHHSAGTLVLFNQRTD